MSITYRESTVNRIVRQQYNSLQASAKFDKELQWSLRIKDTLGVKLFVLYSEAVLWWEIQIIIESTIIISIGATASVLYIEVVLWWEGPL